MKYIADIHTEVEYNCNDCPYQGTTQRQLNNHINVKHRLESDRTEDVFNCKYCGEQFGEKWNLMYHRKLKHLNTVASCQKNKENKCRHSSEMCWWNHDAPNSNIEISCFNCSKTFNKKGEMMIHRKTEHGSIVKNCMNFKQNNCRFTDNFCWFLHEVIMDVDDKHVNEKALQENKKEIKQNEEMNENKESVFQKSKKITIIT